MIDIEYNTLELKKFIDELRLKGINDFEIMKVLELKPRPLGQKTYEIYTKIRTGKIDLKDNMETNAKKVKLKSGKSAFKYHLDKLVEYGYIIR